jgi:hypothetical protein
MPISEIATRRFLRVGEFASLFNIERQRAYEILRQNPTLVVKLGQRQIRVDRLKLDEWVKEGGVKNVR